MTTDDPIKKSSFGACTFAKSSPAELAPGTPALNVVISFEEALKLNLAIDECVRKLNSYNRATTEGKSAGMQLVIHLDKQRIRVLEGAVK